MSTDTNFASALSLHRERSAAAASSPLSPRHADALRAHEDQFRLYAAAAPAEREELRKQLVLSSRCRAVDDTIGTKIASQRTLSGGFERFPWYPLTFLWPDDAVALARAYAARGGAARWIAKEPWQNRGIGVRTIESLDEIAVAGAAKPEQMIVQLNVADPMLVSGYKWHYRLYVLLEDAPGRRRGGVASAFSLWMFGEAAVRFGTAPYSDALSGDGGWRNKQAHVTNSAANEGAVDYCTALPWRLRTLSATLAHIQNSGETPGLRGGAVWAQSRRVISRAFGEGLRAWASSSAAACAAGNTTACAGLSPARLRRLESRTPAELAHAAAAGKPQKPCRGVYGIDLLLDARQRVWLLEVQQGPQMDCACPQDEVVKDGLMRALLRHDTAAIAARRGTDNVAPPSGLVPLPLLLTEADAAAESDDGAVLRDEL